MSRTMGVPPPHQSHFRLCAPMSLSSSCGRRPYTRRKHRRCRRVPEPRCRSRRTGIRCPPEPPRKGPRTRRGCWSASHPSLPIGLSAMRPRRLSDSATGRRPGQRRCNRRLTRLTSAPHTATSAERALGAVSSNLPRKIAPNPATPATGQVEPTSPGGGRTRDRPFAHCAAHKSGDPASR